VESGQLGSSEQNDGEKKVDVNNGGVRGGRKARDQREFLSTSESGGKKTTNSIVLARQRS